MAGHLLRKNDTAKNLIFLLSPIIVKRIFSWRDICYASMVSIYVFMTGSVTCMLFLAGAIVFIAGPRVVRRMRSRSALVTTQFILLALLCIAAITVVEFSSIAGWLGLDPMLTGRTDICAGLLESAQQRPLLGYGYSAFWTGTQGESSEMYERVHWVFSYAHNGILEVMFQLGIAGVSLVVIALVQAIRDNVKVVRASVGVGADWLACLLFMTLAYNLDEGTILFTHSMVSLLFIVVCVGLTRESRFRRSLKMLRPLPKSGVTRGGVRAA